MLISTIALAQQIPGDADGGAVRALIAAGDEQFALEQWENALLYYERAAATAAIEESSAIHLKIAECSTKLARYGTAYQAFGKALETGYGRLTEIQIEDIGKRQGGLAQIIGAVIIENGADGAAVFINGVQRGPLPQASRLWVAMGETSVKIVDGDTVAYEGDFTLAAGEKKIIVVEERVPPAHPEPTPATPPTPAAPVTPQNYDAPMDGHAKGIDDSLSYDRDSGPVRSEEPGKRFWSWIALGAGAVVVGTGASIGIVGLAREKDTRKFCSGDTCPDWTREEFELQENMYLAADILYIVGGLTLATGITLFIVEPRMGGESTSVAVAPTVTPNGGALMITGNF